MLFSVKIDLDASRPSPTVMVLLSRLPDCVLTAVFEFARCRALLRRVSRRYRLHVDKWLLPSASTPLQLTIPLDPRTGGRRAWEVLLSRIRPRGACPRFWEHRSLRLVSPPLAAVSRCDPRPARIAAWPTLINCLRAACNAGVAAHIAVVELEFGAPYVDRLNLDVLRPFGVLTVTEEEVRLLFSRTSLRSFVLRAAASDRTTQDTTHCFTLLPILLARLSFGLAQCPTLRRLEIVDHTPSVYGTGFDRGKHAVCLLLPLATHLLLSTPLCALRLEGVSGDASESYDFWEAISELGRSIQVELVDTAIRGSHCNFQ